MDVKSVSGSLNSSNQVDMKKKEVSSSDFSAVLSEKIQDEEKLMEACQMLESFFIKEILKSSDTSMLSSEESFMAPSDAEKTFKDMLNDEYAQMMSKGKGIGIADMLYRQLKK